MDDLPYLANSVDAEDLEALVAPPTHFGTAVVVVDMVG
jgi:hypothetical protein